MILSNQMRTATVLTAYFHTRILGDIVVGFFLFVLFFAGYFPQRRNPSYITDACGGYIDQTNGTLQSPSFPELYLPNKVCVWQIVAPEQYRITLNFTHFDLEGNNVNHITLIMSKTLSALSSSSSSSFPSLSSSYPLAELWTTIPFLRIQLGAYLHILE